MIEIARTAVVPRLAVLARVAVTSQVIVALHIVVTPRIVVAPRTIPEPRISAEPRTVLDRLLEPSVSLPLVPHKFVVSSNASTSQRAMWHASPDKKVTDADFGRTVPVEDSSEM
ncbi:unnamed protein product [Gongylonema pulchrum]|uniref:Secreted protein n=1 Tax=Gongylonema pulchrum TaxID=637853 RepID=A0A183D9G0_9BILA|nr:unnamed protein product [Gongylonema pulchrum]